MRSIRIAVISFLLVMLLPFPCLGANNFFGVRDSVQIWASGGLKGCFTGSFGFRKNSIGLELGCLFNSEMSKDDFLDYPCPHGDYTVLGINRVGNTLGMDLLYFYSPNNYIFSVYGGLGVYVEDQSKIVRSNATGWIYRNAKNPNTVFPFSAGVKYLIDRKYEIGAGYHALRGVNVQFSLTLK